MVVHSNAKNHERKLRVNYVIKQLWPSTLETFLATWATFLDQYRCIYHQLLSLDRIHSYVEHCTILHHQLLTHLFIEQKTQELFYSNQSYVGPDYQSLQRYCCDRRHNAYWLWYALYCDCISYLFIDQLCPVPPDSFNAQRFEQAELLYDQMSALVKHLDKSPYQKRYTRQLQRYQELLNVARSEL
jgi:hypothetical protein